MDVPVALDVTSLSPPLRRSSPPFTLLFIVFDCHNSIIFRCRLKLGRGPFFFFFSLPSFSLKFLPSPLLLIDTIFPLGQTEKFSLFFFLFFFICSFAFLTFFSINSCCRRWSTMLSATIDCALKNLVLNVFVHYVFILSAADGDK